MFAARDVIVCLAFFAVMYGALSCLVSAAWWLGRQLRPSWTSLSARALFGIRILPFAASALVAVFFTFPSFWLMERRSLDEDLTTFLLALCALAFLSVGIVRALNASRLTSRRVAKWLFRPGHASELSGTTTRAARGAPALMLVGIWRPKVLVSDLAKTVLSESELRLAVRHELGHRRSFDNLKKLLMNMVPFPGMNAIERAWREAAELAADDSAVASRQDALDLAAALIKLSRSAHGWTEPETASAFVCGSSSVSTRVHRLLDWRAGVRFTTRWPGYLLFLLILTAVASNYGTALALTHRLTELIVP